MSITSLRARRLRSSVVLLAACMACKDALRPTDVADVYVLERVASDRVPAVIHDEPTLRITLLADTLRLLPNGSGTRIEVRRYEQLGGAISDPADHVIEYDLTFTTEDRRIEVAFACLDTASCIGPPHLIGKPTDEGLRFFYAVSSPVPLIYREVGSE